jgi:hypothetical protein
MANREGGLTRRTPDTELSFISRAPGRLPKLDVQARDAETEARQLSPPLGLIKNVLHDIKIGGCQVLDTVRFLSDKAVRNRLGKLLRIKRWGIEAAKADARRGNL